MLENITDSMNDDGHKGIWYSYIKDMVVYRVRLLNGEFTVYQANGRAITLTPQEVQSIILRDVKDELND